MLFFVALAYALGNLSLVGHGFLVWNDQVTGSDSGGGTSGFSSEDSDSTSTLGWQVGFSGLEILEGREVGSNIPSVVVWSTGGLRSDWTATSTGTIGLG